MALSKTWNRTIIFLVVVVLIISVIITSVKYKRPDKPIEVTEKAVIGVSLEPITALVMIAEENGYFLKNGLDMTVRYYEGGNVAIRDMFEGKIDFTTVADNMVVFNSFKRQDFSVVATIGTSDNEPRIVGRKDRGILGRTDLRGKRMATVKGTGVHYFLYLFLLKHGMSEDDIRLSLKDPTDAFKTFTEGDVDAISTREPFVTQAVEALGDNAVVFEEPRLLIKNYDIVATNALLSKRPGAVKKMLKALIQAEEFATTNQQQAVSIVSKRVGLETAVVMHLLYEMKWKVFLEQSMLTRFEGMAQWMIKDKIVDSQEMPNYIELIHMDSLLSVKPEAVTVIR
ncbi:ABC transporter substrate-binding protein [Candidatus Magnetobacterium casense]|uniref:ABC transporter substrate-binding protein n=1 Tax=Candidatus Magnetobacterium casense TaxID=1455061 RepID=UPI00058C48DB|nr:NrtA/SsuA/CpmA family ABC transporter substrate-binding protein [Candidatus Magnetobacterium casensis]